MVLYVVGAVLLLLTLFLWVGLVANLATMNGSDPAGRGMATAYGLFTIVALYVMLAVLLCFAAWNGAMVGSSRLMAFLLHPLSGAACVAALYLMEDRATRWPLVIPAVAPLLLIVIAVWTFFPALRNANAGVWLVLVIVSLAPWNAVMERQAHRGERQRAAQARVAERQLREEEQRRAENLARFRGLTNESPLWDWIDFAAKDHELREQALERIRLLPRRQADAELMLRRGQSSPLVELPNLDLQPTPALCHAAREYLLDHARSMRPTVQTPPPFHLVAYRFEVYLPGIRWLAKNGCDCGGVVKALEGTVTAYPPSRDREEFLLRLAGVR